MIGLSEKRLNETTAGVPEIERFSKLFWGTASSPENYFVMMTEYQVFFDCSKDESKEIISPATVVAGFVSTVENWGQWETDWRLALASFDVPYFHMKEFNAPDKKDGAFADIKWQSETYRSLFVSR